MTCEAREEASARFAREVGRGGAGAHRCAEVRVLLKEDAVHEAQHAGARRGGESERCRGGERRRTRRSSWLDRGELASERLCAEVGQSVQRSLRQVPAGGGLETLRRRGERGGEPPGEGRCARWRSAPALELLTRLQLSRECASPVPAKGRGSPAPPDAVAAGLVRRASLLLLLLLLPPTSRCAHCTLACGHGSPSTTRAPRRRRPLHPRPRRRPPPQGQDQGRLLEAPRHRHDHEAVPLQASSLVRRLAQRRRVHPALSPSLCPHTSSERTPADPNSSHLVQERRLALYQQDVAKRRSCASLFLERNIANERADLVLERAQYVGHRFTNGPVFTEYVAQTLRVPLISYGALSLSRCSSPRPQAAEADARAPRPQRPAAPRSRTASRPAAASTA